ncbi:MAG: hypothetical protein J0I12_11925 [Candidatus Eremiobacteraeota bacterium]|nr:hypothetical protein [Candidatus Eremiobacteraeota bacterium]
MMRRRAFTLLELCLAGALLTLFMFVGYTMLRMAEKVYYQVSGNEDATMQLKRAVRMLHKDLISALADTVGSAGAPALNVVNVPASLPGGASDGTGVCLLSPYRNGSGEMVMNTDGPEWQRNIIYYTVVPGGDPCAGGADANGFDDRCPHKVLVRKVLNLGTTPQTPLPIGSIAGHLTRPLSPKDISNFSSEANLTESQIVAHGLVGLRVQTHSTHPALMQDEVIFTVTAFNQPRSRKLAVGSVALTGQPGFLVNSMAVFPRNNRP